MSGQFFFTNIFISLTMVRSSIAMQVYFHARWTFTSTSHQMVLVASWSRYLAKWNRHQRAVSSYYGLGTSRLKEGGVCHTTWSELWWSEGLEATQGREGWFERGGPTNSTVGQIGPCNDGNGPVASSIWGCILVVVGVCSGKDVDGRLRPE